ncbi:MAG: 50S ribosomal protein L17, partial [Planctomycetaceae bacterium]|nr:50S ribosomal protein L17 [Planctomycetaceae bacterium]
TVRLGDAGEQAIIEFVGERDRVKPTKRSSTLEASSPAATEEPAAAEEAPAEEAVEESAETTAEAPETDEEKEA